MAKARKVKKVGDRVIRLKNNLQFGVSLRHRFDVVYGKIGKLSISSQSVQVASLHFDNGAWMLSTVGNMMWLSAPFNAWISRADYCDQAKEFIDLLIADHNAISKGSRVSAKRRANLEKRKKTVFDPKVWWTFAVGAFEPRRTRRVEAYSYPEARERVKDLLDQECLANRHEAPVAWDLELLEM